MAHPLAPRRVPARTHRGPERAFTLIEVIIVLVIIAVLIAIAWRAQVSAKSASMRKGAIAAARSYGDAIEDFRKDHGGRPPVLGNARDWPTAASDKGPVNGYDSKPYLHGATPESVDAKQAKLVRAGGTTTAARFALQYTPNAAAPGGWVIVVRDQQGRVPACYVSSGVATLPTGMGTC